MWRIFGKNMYGNLSNNTEQANKFFYLCSSSWYILFQLLHVLRLYTGNPLVLLSEPTLSMLKVTVSSSITHIQTN